MSDTTPNGGFSLHRWGRIPLLFFLSRPRLLRRRLGQAFEVIREAEHPGTRLRLVFGFAVGLLGARRLKARIVLPATHIGARGDAVNEILRLIEFFGQGEVEKALAWWYAGRHTEEEAERNLEAAADLQIKAGALLGLHFDPPEGSDRRGLIASSLALASIFHRQHRQAEAKAHFRRAFDLDPENPAMQNDIGENLARHGTRAEILEYFNRVLEVNPESQMARFILGVHDGFPDQVARLEEAFRAAPQGSPGKRRILVVLPIWGRDHVDIFLRYTLPLLLEPGNLPALARDFDLFFPVFTTKEDEARLRGDANFARLERLAHLHFIHYAGAWMSFTWHQVGRFQLMSLTHYAALECARRVDTDVVLVFPDNLVSENFYGNLARALKEDFGAVVCPGFRLEAGSLLSAVDRDYRSPDGRIAIPPAGIARLLIDHLDESWFVDSSRFAISPFFLCWRVEGGGFVARATHLQPYAIRARHLNKALAPKIDPLDAQFLVRHLDEAGKATIRRLMGVEMCALDAGESPSLDPQPIEGENRFDERTFARFLHTYDSPLHRDHIRLPIRVGTAPSGEAWERVERESAEAMERTFALIDAFEAVAPRIPEWAREADARLITES
jgi:tetratricopeptide (TPR) repeat protein